jgi:two-component system response regulator VicR
VPGVAFSILLVDDEESLVKGLTHTLKKEGFTVKAAYDGLAGLEEFRRGDFDLIILDLMLPELDGLEVCRKIREKSTIPIIMLTAKGDDIERIVGLEVGADDYLPKPFNSRELVARIYALLRRTRGRSGREEEIKIGDITIHLPAFSATVRGKKVDFTRKEFALLSLLAKNPGRVFNREELLAKIWGAAYYDLRTVDVCIGRLRKKLEQDPNNPRHILTRWGVGYYMTE